MSPSSREYTLDPKDVADSSELIAELGMSRRAWLTIGGTALAAGVSWQVRTAYAAEPLCTVVTAPKIAEFGNGSAYDADKVITGVNSSSQLVVLSFTTDTALHCTGTISSSQLHCYFKAKDYLRVKLNALDPAREVRIYGNVVETDVSNAAWRCFDR